MDSPTRRHRPGPDARLAFRTGMIAAAVAGIAGIGLLYWVGTFTLTLALYALLLLFPVYLVGAATALSVWLGYDTDVTDLRPVYVEQGRQ
jgi:4-hydroxybenzoate polyprenyltransferase